ncbi:barstar family protein [Streptomyces violascens]|uniref:barstar family protein n=1 Tax=Streptomyces violascens TaxID=67381 RepID=UPI0036D00AC5
MNTPTFTEPRSPWVVVTQADDPWVRAETSKLREKRGRVFRLNGHELRDPASLFTAFARELSFPDYFGGNWDALVDCLHDWHGDDEAQGVVVVIEHADDLLSAEFLGLFVSVLCQAAWNANLQLDAEGAPHDNWPALALHFALLLDHTPPSAFAEPAAQGMDVGVAMWEDRLTATLTGTDWPGSDPAVPVRSDPAVPVP